MTFLSMNWKQLIIKIVFQSFNRIFMNATGNEYVMVFDTCYETMLNDLANVPKLYTHFHVEEVILTIRW